ncbi:MAG: hypothetical protein KC561_03575, partial [Myxococcales bacterium]|nr:hypothetical protein [Myxococcales bacterium]
SLYEATPFAEVDFGPTDSEEGSYEGVGIAILDPVSEDAPMEICVRPNGRILNRETAEPFPGTGGLMAGNANIWVQWAPVREVDGVLIPPREQVTITYPGLVSLVERQ